MFCKYCGKSIPDGSAFCTECGKPLKQPELPEQPTTQGFPTPLALLLLVICWPTVYEWGHALLFGDNLFFSSLISTVMLIAGLILFFSMVSRERICLSDYRFSDLLVLGCVWLAVPFLVEYCESSFIRAYGQYIYWGWQDWNSYSVPAIQFPAFWLMLGITALGLSRRGNLQPTKKHRLILLAALLLISFLGFVFAVSLAASVGSAMESIEATAWLTRSWVLLCWLWPILILKVFRTLGEGRIGVGGAAAALLGMQLFRFLLMPIFLFSLDLGVNGFGLTVGIAPILGLVILTIATKLHKKRT